jgi:hypothetical protein
MDAVPPTNPKLDDLFDFLMNVVFVYYMHAHILTQPDQLNDTIRNNTTRLCVVIKEKVTKCIADKKSVGETLNSILHSNYHRDNLQQTEFTLFKFYIEMLHILQPGLKKFISQATEFAFLQEWESKFANN